MNPMQGEVTFEAGGKSYGLRWSTNAMCEIEEATGQGVNAIARELASWSPPVDADGKPKPETEEQAAARANRVRIKLVRVVFWAMLRDRHPDIDLKAAGDLMQQAGGLVGAIDLIARAFERGAAPETKGTRPPNGSAMIGSQPIGTA